MKKEWSADNFGKDRDLYDKDGNQIFRYAEDGQLQHRDLDENTNQWKNSWHNETKNMNHSSKYTDKENYRRTVQKDLPY